MKELAYKLRLIFAILFFILTITFVIFVIINPAVLQGLPLIKLGITAIILMFIIILLFGRIGCSLVCPLGIFQEIVSLFFDKQNEKRTNWYGKYIIMFICIILSVVFALKYNDLLGFNVVKVLAVLTLILFISTGIIAVFKDRLFCTHICPCGTLAGLISKKSLFKMIINKEKCVCCGICERNCPSCSIESLEESIDNETCVKCLKCMSSCPKGAIDFTIRKK